MSRITRIVKWSVLTLLALPMFAFLAFISALHFIDFNKYKSLIEQEFAQKTGHVLRLEGDLDLGAFPLRLQAEQVALLTEQATPWLSIAHLQLGLSWEALLLQRQLKVEAVLVEKAILQAVQGANGRFPWQTSALLFEGNSEDRFQKVSGVDWSDAAKWTGYKPTVQKALIWLDQQGFELKQLDVLSAEVNLLAQENPIAISNLNLAVRDFAQNQPFEVKADWQAVQAGQTRHHADLHTQVTLARTKLHLQPLRLQLSGADRQELAWQSLDWNLADNRVRVQGLQWQRQDQTLHSDFEISDSAPWTGSGVTAIQNWNLRKTLDGLNIAYPDFVDSTVLTQWQGKWHWHWEPQAWQVSKIDMRIDQTSFQGEVSYSESAGALYQLNLQIGDLDLDRYQAKVLNSESKTAHKSGAKQGSSVDATPETYVPLAIPVTTLRETQWQGQVKLEQLKLWQVSYQQVHIGVNGEYGELNLAPFDARLYGGEWQSNLKIEVNHATPQYEWKGRWSGVDGQAWLQDALNYSQLRGSLSGRFHLKSAGSNAQAIKYHMNGPFSMQLVNGVFQGLDMNALLSGESPQAESATPLQKVEVVGEVINGVFYLQDARLVSERFQAQVLGKVHLAKAEVDAELLLTYSEPPSSMRFLTGVQLPVKVNGLLTEPVLSVDLNQVLQQNQQRLRQRFGL
jgi:AsmA protein